MNSLDDIKKHWNENADNFRSTDSNNMGNTLKDQNLRRLEIEAITQHLAVGMNVLDIGCGNGYSTIEFAKKYDINIHGMDYSEIMIENAVELVKSCEDEVAKRVNFMAGNILEKQSIRSKYDAVITERCLINLETWDNQKIAIGNIHNALNDHGLFLMLEGFNDNLEEINKIRERYDLKPIEVVWHNHFFDKAIFEEYISKYFDILKSDNFGSTYMLITRTFLHAMTGVDIPSDKLDYLATLLPNIGNYNYQQLYVLKKK